MSTEELVTKLRAWSKRRDAYRFGEPDIDDILDDYEEALR